METLNILSLCGLPPWHPKSRGGYVISYEMSEAISRLGHNIHCVIVAQRDPQHSGQWDSMTYVDPRRSSFSRLWESLKMDLEQFDIIHVHEVNETVGDALAHGIRRGYLSKSHGAKLCIGIYNPEVHRLPRSIQEIVWQFASRNADGIVSLSHYSKENISKAYRVPEDRILVSYPGVNKGFFGIVKKESERERATLLFCGRINRLHDQKGIDVLIESLPIIARKHDIILRIVGGGTHTSAIERFVKERGIGESVQFIGSVEHSSLPEIYAGADIFVLPSRRESFGLAIAEAMAVGLPVISTDVGAIPEVVMDYETGILVPPNSPSELASAVDVLLSDRTKMKEFGFNGRNRAATHFTWEEAAKRIERFYREIIMLNKSSTRQPRERNSAGTTETVIEFTKWT